MPIKPTRVSILSSAHPPLDERIFYHFAPTLQNSGMAVSIITATEDRKEEQNGVRLDCFDSATLRTTQKISAFKTRLSDSKATIVICQEPLPLFAAYLYKKQSANRVKIVYDITEWQPSTTQLGAIKNPLKRLAKGIALFTLNLLAASLAHAFIFGERAKRFPLRWIFPLKKNALISYYPDIDYFPKTHNSMSIPREWTLGYTGNLSEGKGIFHFLKVITSLEKRFPTLHFKLLFIGTFESQETRMKVEKALLQQTNVTFEFSAKLPFLEFCERIKEMDICFDLRNRDWEARNGLPIKLFYYMACGKTVIYSDLDAIRKEVPEIETFGHLVQPEDTDKILEILSSYLNSDRNYLSHSANARHCFDTKYNWSQLSPVLIDFLESIDHD